MSERTRDWTSVAQLQRQPTPRSPPTKAKSEATQSAGPITLLLVMMSLLLLRLLLRQLQSLLLLHSVHPTSPMENKRVVKTKRVRQTGGSIPATVQGRGPYAGRSTLPHSRSAIGTALPLVRELQLGSEEKGPPRADSDSDSGSPAQAGENEKIREGRASRASFEHSTVWQCEIPSCCLSLRRRFQESFGP